MKERGRPSLCEGRSGEREWREVRSCRGGGARLSTGLVRAAALLNVIFMEADCMAQD